MTQPKDPLIEALLAGRSYTWTTPDGGYFASMRAAYKHGQTLTMSPVTDPGEIQVGDIVCVKWHQGYMTHLVHEIQGEQFLIANSVGKINGWVSTIDILGRVTQVINPPPRPGVPEMLDLLEGDYRKLIQRQAAAEDLAQRLLGVVDDLRWYAGRIGEARWDDYPRTNLWSFAQNLWRLTKQARDGAQAPTPPPMVFCIDRGKECVGMAAEALALFEV